MDKTLNIGQRTVGAKDLFFTVEEGMANLGDYTKALRMVDAVAATGADAIEFQFVIAADLYIQSHPGFSFCRGLEFSKTQISDLAAYIKSKGLEFLAVPLSQHLVEPLVKAGCSAFNINASDINNPDIIDAVATSGKPFFLSSPLAMEKEIDWAVERIRRKGAATFVLMHGQHTMMSGGGAVDAADTTLGYIRTLKQRYGLPVGFIDHTPFVWMPTAAVVAGADAISKHLALSRADQGPDWQVCLEPEEMKQAVMWARAAKASIQVEQKILAAGEDLDRQKMRRSIVAIKPLKAGHVIVRQDIGFKRPGTGLAPSAYEQVVGKMIVRDVEENTLIRSEDLKEA